MACTVLYYLGRWAAALTDIIYIIQSAPLRYQERATVRFPCSILVLPDTDPISAFAYLMRPRWLPMSHPCQAGGIRFTHSL